MDFSSEIQLFLSKAIQKALNDSKATSLDARLNITLDEILRKKADGELSNEMMKDLCLNIVYFVFNITDIRNNKRAFHAALNWANLNKEVRLNQLTESNLTKIDLSSNQITAGVIPFSTIKNLFPTEDQRKYLYIAWNTVWYDYYKLTLENELKNPKLLTLNQWLLFHMRCPVNFGVYWGHTTDHFDKNYVYLSETTLEELGIPNPIKKSSDLIKLPREFAGTFNDNSDLLQIYSMFEEMGQLNDSVNNLQNIAFSIYNLIRSYGCWGGNSFYSIPINYGNYSDPRRGILSLCSTKPLNSDLILKWYLVANKIFKDIILHEINLFNEYERKSNFVGATYSLGHNLKNRVLDGDKKIGELKKEMESIIDRLNTNSTVKIDKRKILEQISSVGLQVKSLSNTGNLLDLIAKAMSEKHKSIFSLKEDWFSEDEKSLNNFLISFYKDKFYVVSKLGIFGSISNENLSKDLKIKPWLIHEETIKKIRPADFVYEEIFFELFVNALSYGNPFIKNGKNFVRIDISSQGNKIFVSNTPNIPLKENKKFNAFDSNKELAVEQIGHGGLLYIKNFLDITNVGTLCILLDKDDNKFKVVVSFNGVINEE